MDDDFYYQCGRCGAISANPDTLPSRCMLRQDCHCRSHRPRAIMPFMDRLILALMILFLFTLAAIIGSLDVM